MYICIYMTEVIKLDSNLQTTGLTRDPIDKYYTKDSIAELCIGHIKDICPRIRVRGTLRPLCYIDLLQTCRISQTYTVQDFGQRGLRV